MSRNIDKIWETHWKTHYGDDAWETVLAVNDAMFRRYLEQLDRYFDEFAGDEETRLLFRSLCLSDKEHWRHDMENEDVNTLKELRSINKAKEIGWLEDRLNKLSIALEHRERLPKLEFLSLMDSVSEYPEIKIPPNVQKLLISYASRKTSKLGPPKRRYISRWFPTAEEMFGQVGKIQGLETRTPSANKPKSPTFSEKSWQLRMYRRWEELTDSCSEITKAEAIKILIKEFNQVNSGRSLYRRLDEVKIWLKEVDDK